MHAEHKTRQTSQHHKSTNMAPIDEALTAIEALEPGTKLSYTKLAAKYGVGRSTLSRRHQAATQSNATKNINQQKLTLQ